MPLLLEAQLFLRLQPPLVLVALATRAPRVHPTTLLAHHHADVLHGGVTRDGKQKVRRQHQRFSATQHAHHAVHLCHDVVHALCRGQRFHPCAEGGAVEHGVRRVRAREETQQPVNDRTEEQHPLGDTLRSAEKAVVSQPTLGGVAQRHEQSGPAKGAHKDALQRNVQALHLLVQVRVVVAVALRLGQALLALHIHQLLLFRQHRVLRLCAQQPGTGALHELRG